MSGLFLRFGLVFCILFLGACKQQEAKQIQWQLPLSAPTDPHGVQSKQVLPDWAAKQKGRASLELLQKSTSRIFSLDLASGDKMNLNRIQIRLLGLAHGLRIKSGSYIDDKNVHNPAAFVQVSLTDRIIYRGWVYQEFPELFGPDMADWKLTLRGTSIETAVEKVSEPAEKARARSSAG